MTSDYYQTRYTYNEDRKKVWKAICRYLSRYISPQSSVLDIGSGYCDFINNIKAKSKTAIDSDPASKGFCNPEITFINIDVTKTEFEEKSFDVVFVSNLFEHLDEHDLDLLTNKIYKWLKEKGTLILVQPNYYYAYREYWDDYTHKKAFSHVSLSDFLISKRFKILKIEKKFLPYSFKSLLPKSYLMTRLYLKSLWRPFAKQMLIIAEKQTL
jgi:SAM-dependent methyltransferase